MSVGRLKLRLVLGAGLVLLVALGTARTAPPPIEVRSDKAMSSLDKIKTAAETAERQGDWEAAFSLQCRLLLTDRTPAAREKVSALLRKAQQARRHRDPAFQQFVDKLTVSDALNLYAEMVTKLPSLYADRDKASPRLLWEHGLEELDRALVSPTYRRVYLEAVSPEKLADFRKSLREAWAGKPITSAKDARGQLRQLVNLAAEKLALRNPSAVAIEFVCGACSGLDDYTIFLTPGQASVDQAAVVADLQPYGIYLSFTEGMLKVQGIVPNSWAAINTPLVPGDRILRVNGRLFDPGSPTALADALRNPTGLTHRLEIVGPVPDMLPNVEVPVTVPTVFGATILRDGIAYLRLGSFRDTTARELDDALEALKNQGMRSLILDLRGNHGGLFATGVQVTQRFLPAGIIVTTQGQVGDYAGRVFSSDSGIMAWDIPLVLLVDGETASAAEVLAGALKDHARGTLVGLPTFGKGSIQFPVKLVSIDDMDEMGRLRDRSGAVRVTIAKLVSPRGVAITGQGVSPHIMEPDPLRQIEMAVLRAAEALPPGPPVVP
jgi:carboxyl-terminal processing protease